MCIYVYIYMLYVYIYVYIHNVVYGMTSRPIDLFNIHVYLYIYAYMYVLRREYQGERTANSYNAGAQFLHIYF